MLLRLSLILAVLCSTLKALPRPQSQDQPQTSAEPRQILYLPERQQYPHDLQYDLSLLEPQFQIPYNFIGDKPFPRVQPQIVFYNGGPAPGQPFLLQPGPPPGNFLVPQPQPGPNVILRDDAQRPVFVAGYPKPAHIPPIEKDAEEVPTNPAKIPPLKPNKGNPAQRKPEKLETFNEQDDSKKTATEADALADADRYPYSRAHLQPGHRFFILNGQPLFSYPFNNQIYPGINPNINLKYLDEPQLFNPTQPPTKDVKDLFVRNGITGQINDVASQRENPENLVLLNQPQSQDFQNEAIFRTALPLQLSPLTKDIKLQQKDDLKNDDEENYNLEDSEDDSIIIDAREQDEIDDDEANTESDKEEASSPAPGKSREPTISQAQPIATALAGPGGVAAAAPRGSAFVGKEGVAVSSPQATAVAGPSREGPETDNKKPQTKRKP